MKKFIVVICFDSLILCGGYKKGSDSTTSSSQKDTTTQDIIPQLPGWKLIWNDEFNGTLVDMKKWEY